MNTIGIVKTEIETLQKLVDLLKEETTNLSQEAEETISNIENSLVSLASLLKDFEEE